MNASPGTRKGNAPGPVPGWLLLYVVGTAIATVVIGALLAGAPERRVSYTELKQLIRANEVAEIVIGPTMVRASLKKDNQRIDAIRVDDPSLLADLEQHGVNVTGQLPSGGWDWLLWVVPIALMMYMWTRGMQGLQGQGALSFARSRAKVYAEDEVKITFADVAGIDEAIEELREIVDFLRHPEKYTALGGHIPKGVLLLGPPGTGKTLLARAVAGEAHVPFFSLSGSEFVELFVGVGAARVRDLFKQAEERAPCIIFIDELDALGKARAVSPLGTHEEREQTLNQLLAEMDGFDPRKGVIVMSATNRPEVLDPALLRPGRFDRRVVVDRPDVRGREAILRLHARAVKLAADVDLTVVAGRTTGLAGADLANLVNEATLLAARRGQTHVTMADFEEALDRVLAGLKRKRVMTTREREIIAAHEAGHAIVASAVPGADPVHKISIVQRGYEALGHTLQLPAEDRYLRTRRELWDQLAVWLGGRAAEEVVFGEITTGAQNDLQHATEMARAMIAQYGMSEQLGPIALPATRARFLSSGAVEPSETVSEETARAIDREVKQLMTGARERAIEILREHRSTLDAVVQLLLAREVVDGSDVRRLLQAESAQPSLCASA